MKFLLMCVLAVALALPFASQSLEFDENQGITTQNNSTDLGRAIDSFEIENEHKRNEYLSESDVVTQQKQSPSTIILEKDLIAAIPMVGIFILFCFTILMVKKMMDDILYWNFLEILMTPPKCDKA